MKISLIAVGKNMPGWVVDACACYAKRLTQYCQFTLAEIPISKRHKNASIDSLITKEGQAIQTAIPLSSKVIALEVEGKPWSTQELAKFLQVARDNAENLTFLIGGPDGLDPSLSASADHQWSLSCLTLPHALARVIVLEQLFRGWAILHNHPYHREG